MTADRLRDRWATGTYGRLAWCSITDPHLLEMTAATGQFDAMVLDVQHGGFHRAAVVDAIRALARWDLTLLARVPSADPDLIGWLLDSGLDGVIVAMCESAEMAESIVNAVRYAPGGTRSYGVYRVRPHDVDPIDYSRRVIVLPMVESLAGLEHVEEIVAVDGVDGVFIGPGDLGLALGHGAAQNRTEGPMLDAFATIRSAAHAHGKKVGIFATTTAYAHHTAGEGYDLVVPWFDSPAIGAALAAAVLP